MPKSFGRLLRRKRLKFRGRISPESARESVGQSIRDSNIIDTGIRASTLYDLAEKIAKVDPKAKEMIESREISRELSKIPLKAGSKGRRFINKMDDRIERLSEAIGEFTGSSPITKHFEEKGREIRNKDARFAAISLEKSKAPPSMAGPIVDWVARDAAINEIKRETQSRFAKIQHAIDKAMAKVETVIGELAENGINLSPEKIAELRQKAHFLAIASVR